MITVESLKYNNKRLVNRLLFDLGVEAALMEKSFV